MTDIESAWVAGLLEGEGCFTITWDRGYCRNIRVVCAMTDGDVLEKLKAIAGGNVVGPCRPKGYKAHWKSQWRWSISGIRRVRDLLTAIAPHMGVRRSARIKEILTYCDQRIEANRVGTVSRGRRLAEPISSVYTPSA